MNELVEIREPMLSGDDLLARWTGIYSGELASIIDENAETLNELLPVYRFHKAFYSGNGIIAECYHIPIELDCNGDVAYRPYLEDSFDFNSYDFSKICFKLSDVVRYEKFYPKVLRKKVNISDLSQIGAMPGKATTPYSEVAKLEDGMSNSESEAKLVPKKPEYIPAEDLRKEVNLSPSMFVELLRDHRDLLPLHGFAYDNDRSYFYSRDVEPVIAAEMLSDKTVHCLDWEHLTREWENEGQEDLQNDGKDTRIAELEAQLTEVQKQLTEAQQTAPATSPLDNDNSLAAMVCKMRYAGKEEEEIAAHLYDDGEWCTQSQVGALLHADESRVVSSSMQQRARRLLGKI